jgi:hypothetical protein
MLCYAAVRRVLVARSMRSGKPAPLLDRPTHVQAMGLSPEKAEQLHEARIAVVEFDDAFRIGIVDIPDPGQGQTPR